jgi:hypothetical protein
MDAMPTREAKKGLEGGVMDEEDGGRRMCETVFLFQQRRDTAIILPPP